MLSVLTWKMRELKIKRLPLDRCFGDFTSSSSVFQSYRVPKKVLIWVWSFCYFSSLLNILYEQQHNKMCRRESPTRQDTNWLAQLQKLARVLKFRLYNLRYYTIYAVKNKDADQTAWMHKTFFLMAWFICSCTTELLLSTNTLHLNIYE